MEYKCFRVSMLQNFYPLPSDLSDGQGIVVSHPALAAFLFFYFYQNLNLWG